MEPNQIIAVADLSSRLYLRELEACEGEEQKSALTISTIKALSIPLKQCLQSHHLEKQCAYELMQRMLSHCDKKAAKVLEAKFGGKLLCKTNEPEKL